MGHLIQGVLKAPVQQVRDPCGFGINSFHGGQHVARAPNPVFELALAGVYPGPVIRWRRDIIDFPYFTADMLGRACHPQTADGQGQWFVVRVHLVGLDYK